MDILIMSLEKKEEPINSPFQFINKNIYIFFAPLSEITKASHKIF